MGQNFPFTYQVNGLHRATLFASVVISENQWSNSSFRVLSPRWRFQTPEYNILQILERGLDVTHFTAQGYGKIGFPLTFDSEKTL